MRERTLTWDGCLNVRDLGGHATEQGGETRFGEIVRADSVRQLSDEGWEALVAYGVRTIVDLRFHEELEADPPRELPVELVHVQLLGEQDPEVAAELDAIGAAAAEPELGTRDVYLEFLERYRENFATAVAAVARADGPVVVHCQGGKDRTGLVVALLLRVAGVPVDDIAADYALSADNLAPAIEEWIAAGETPEEQARRRRISVGTARVMREVLEELDRRYGGVEGYLRAAGVADEDLDRVRARLRPQAPPAP